MPTFNMMIIWSKIDKNPFSVGKIRFWGSKNMFTFIPGNMRPDYSHKIFDDKRLYHFFLRKALVREAVTRR
jgi:hypothetical protein